MYCVNGKPRSSLLIESTDSMIIKKMITYYIVYNFFINYCCECNHYLLTPHVYICNLGNGNMYVLPRATGGGVCEMELMATESPCCPTHHPRESAASSLAPLPLPLPHPLPHLLPFPHASSQTFGHRCSQRTHPVPSRCSSTTRAASTPSKRRMPTQFERQPWPSHLYYGSAGW